MLANRQKYQVEEGFHMATMLDDRSPLIGLSGDTQRFAFPSLYLITAFRTSQQSTCHTRQTNIAETARSFFFFTFNSFPEVVAVPPDGGEFAQVMVGAPDVHVFILRAAHDERVIMTKERRKQTCEGQVRKSRL